MECDNSYCKQSQRGGIRAKLLAADRNHIDVIFLDRRIELLGKYHFGNKLVNTIDIELSCIMVCILSVLKCVYSRFL